MGWYSVPVIKSEIFCYGFVNPGILRRSLQYSKYGERGGLSNKKGRE
jgi:hypothetical protein